MRPLRPPVVSAASDSLRLWSFGGVASKSMMARLLSYPVERAMMSWLFHLTKAKSLSASLPAGTFSNWRGISKATVDLTPFAPARRTRRFWAPSFPNRTMCLPSGEASGVAPNPVPSLIWWPPRNFSPTVSNSRTPMTSALEPSQPPPHVPFTVCPANGPTSINVGTGVPPRPQVWASAPGNWHEQHTRVRMKRCLLTAE
mmetsp:Transcript_3619/g.9595  ORF Transcript_3619/g.9595 Transcript_3619/m.9595 type:complete len:200 (+) Transcript_3619:1169-1768(+)